MTVQSDPTPVPESTPAPDLSIRARPPVPRRLSRKVLLTIVLAAGALMAFALFVGLGDAPRRGQADAPPPAIAAASGPPEALRAGRLNYDPSDLAGRLPPAATEEAEIPEADSFTLDTPPPLQTPHHPMRSYVPAQAPAAAPPPPDPVDIAAASPILFASARAGPAEVAGQGVQTGPRAGFVSAQRNPEERLVARLTPPRSPYELMAGAVIPAALVTELNSDLPGRVIAQVTAPVYDSATGEHLLIPQGARLLGAYDSAVAYGDGRLLLVWNRLVFPNGWSISLQGMEATDPLGASGLSDRTDNHMGRLVGAIVLSSVISVGANEARDRGGGVSMSENIADAAAQQAAQTGARIVDRELNVRPTLRVRAGAPVRVLVGKDIQLRPYRPE